MGGLVIFLLVVFFVALIGHAIWELVAWMLRGFGPRPAAPASVLCPHCGKQTITFPCRMCGFVPGDRNAAPPAQSSGSGLSITREVIAELAARGLISEATQSDVIIALKRATLADTHEAKTEELVTAQLRPMPPLPPVLPTPPIPPIPPIRPEPVVPRPTPRAPAAPPVAAPPPRPPAKPLSEILRAFMQEKNIRWGELAGAILIVGCSIALVISLWAQIAQRPFLKVGVFTAVVAGLFGLGLYADRKWKIPTTSWGILLTAMLLVPLHFGAMVVLGGGAEESLTLLVEAAGALVLAVLSYLAAGVIGPRWRLMLAGGVVVLSLLGPVLYVVGAIPALKSLPEAMTMTGVVTSLYLATATLALVKIRRCPSDQALPSEAMCLMGMLLAAAIPSLVMEWYFVRNLPGLWSVLAPMLALLAAPILTGAAEVSQRVGKEREGWRTGLWLTQVAAALAMALWVVVAWPVPWAVVTSALVLVVVLGGNGYRWRNAGQLTAAGVFLLVAYLAALPAVMGRLPWDSQTGQLLEAMWSARFGIELIPAQLLMGLAALAVWRRERNAGQTLAALSGVLAVVGLACLACVVYFAEIDVAGTAWVFGGYAAALLAAAVLLRRPEPAIAGTALALLTLERVIGGELPGWTIAALILMTAWALVAGSGRYQAGRIFAWVDSQVAGLLAWSLGGLSALLIGGMVTHSLGTSLGYAWWLTGAVVLLFVAGRGAAELNVLQAVIAAAGVMTVLAHAPWGQNDPRAWVCAALLLLTLHGAWLTAARLGRWAVLYEGYAARGLGLMVGAGLLLFAAFCGWELASYELLRGMASANYVAKAMLVSSFQGVWIGLALLGINGALEAWASRQRAWLLLSVVACYAVALALATRVSPELAASAMRMTTTLVIVLIATLCFAPTKLRDLRTLWGLNLALGTALLVGLTLFAAGAQLAGTGPKVPAPGSFFAAIGAFGSYVAPLMLLVLAYVAHAVRERSPWLAMAACGLVNLTVTLAFVLQVGIGKPVDVLQLLQLNAAACGLCALLWLLGRFLMNIRTDVWPGIYVLAALCCLCATSQVLWVNGQVWLMARLGNLAGEVCGGPLGWIVIGCTVALGWLLWRHRLRVSGVALLAVVAGAATATLAGLLLPASWAAFYALLCGYVVGAWAVYAVASVWARAAEVPLATVQRLETAGDVRLDYAQGGSGLDVDRLLASARRWGIALAMVASLFALRAAVDDPMRPWWTTGTFVMLAVLGLVVAQRELRPGYLYPATLMLNLAASFLWGSHYWSGTGHRIRDLVLLNVMTLAGAGLASLVLELSVFRGRLAPTRQPLHKLASWVCVALLMAIAAIRLGVADHWMGSADSLLVTLGAAASVLALTIACMWDEQVPQAPALVYASSYVLVAMALDVASLQLRDLIQMGLVCGVGLAGAWGIVLRRWDEVAKWLGGLGARATAISALPAVNAWLAVWFMAVVLGHEMVLAGQFGKAEMQPWLVVVYAALLALIVIGLLAIALERVSDPLRLPVMDRRVYVYSAEVVTGLFFLHLRLTRPELFGGLFMQYWPMAILVLAFVAAGVGEMLVRRGVEVIGGPLASTAMILPAIPALLFAGLPSHVDYTSLLICVTVFYGCYAAYRQSFGLGALAAIAGNAAIWSWLSGHHGLEIARHPQLWFLPPALTVIVASYFARGKLDEKQLGVVRYGALLVAYASSTADVFLVGLANSPWLTGILILLSVAGVMLGIMLQVRSFLFTGFLFLVISLLTLIYHAAANLHQTWLMWLAGIALGVGILLAFAMFEKRKDQVMQLLETVRGWEQ